MPRRRLIVATIAALAVGVGAGMFVSAVGAGSGSFTITRANGDSTLMEVNASGSSGKHLTVAGANTVGGEITFSSDSHQIFSGTANGNCAATDAGSMTQECDPTGLDRLSISMTDADDLVTIPGTFNGFTIGGFGFGGRDELLGGPSPETLDGGDDGDNLKGGGAKDKLLGKAGRDKLNGGGAADICKGGSGKDKVKKC